MEQLFADIPSALTNTVEIAKRCNLTLTLGKSFLPAFPVPDGSTKHEEDYLRQLSQQGLAARWQAAVPAYTDAQQEAHKQRLTFELDTIIDMGFAGYF